MPIHLIWGDDYEACNREIETIVNTFIDPEWRSFNFSQIEGNDPKQSLRALEEVQSPPLGNGSRVVLVRRSSYCNGCSTEMANKLEKAIKLIPNNTHLILYNSIKPDKRLRITKLLQKNIQNNNFSTEKSFVLPLPWDINGQRKLVENIAKSLNLKINPQTIDLIVENVGNDSSLIKTELQKISLFSKALNKNIDNKQQEITSEIVNIMIKNNSFNALEISNLIIKGNIAKAIIEIKHLIDNGEPALRLISTLTGQSRGWLWVHILDSYGTFDVKEIADLTGIANPKRIFVIRKQIQGKSAETLVAIMKQLLKIEASIKSGMKPIDSFKDNLLTESKIATNN